MTLDGASIPGIPAGFSLVRTTHVFDEGNVPAGLLRAHRVADSVWGRLVVRAGALRFVFEDEPAALRRVSAGETVSIPPGRLHHVDIDEPVRFVVEFYRDDTVRDVEEVEDVGSSGPT